MKTLIWIIVIIILLVIGYFIFFDADDVDVPDGADLGDENGDFVTASGTVTDVDLTEVPADGPALVTISSALGRESVIAVPTMNILLCPARANVADVSRIEVGDAVSVAGERDEEGRIVPCDDVTHFLRVTGTTTPTSSPTSTPTTSSAQ